LTPASKSVSIRRQFSAGVTYFGVVIAFLASSFWLLDDLKTRSEEIEAAETRLHQLSDHSRPRPPASLASNARVEGSAFLVAPTVTVAGAALQERIGAAIAKAGGVVTSSQVELDGPEAKSGIVGLTASAEIGQSALQTFLYDVEAGMPYLFVEKLSVQSPEDFGEPETGRMRLTIAVVGQWRPVE
jgi:general secretion pathway protein M